MSRKLFGMVLAAALIIVPMFAASFHSANTNSGAAIADDAKPAPDDGKKADEAKPKENAAKPEEAKPADNPVAKQPEQKPEVMPPALPTCEAPLWPHDPIWVHYPELISSDTYVSIDVIEDGKQKRKYVYGNPEQTVRFVVRTDGWTHVSVQFFDGPGYGFTSATVLVPDEQTKALWENWFAKERAERKKEQIKRTYPSNVLPPK